MSTDVPSQQVVTKEDQRVATPPMFKVVMHNDDYSTMEFVVEVLLTVFHKSVAEAERIMLTIHHKGADVCGVYPFAVAETKVHKVHTLAREAGYPLRCSLEEV